MPKPGPGAYNIPSTIGTGPAKSISGRFELKPSTPTPGPGAYNLGGSVGSSRQYKYTMSGRIESDETKWAATTPGPGAYNVDVPSHKVLISISPRRPVHSPSSTTPGPGAYNASGEILATASPRYTITGRPTTADAFNARVAATPGPGAYNVDIRPRTDRAITMKSRHYPKPSNAQSPGPGQYNVSTPSGSPKFTLSGRLPDFANPRPERSISPGPGAYNVPTLLGRTAPASSIRSRLPNPSIGSASPGPGAYSVESSKWALPRSPAYTIAARPPTASSATYSPGPGQYSTQTILSIGSNQKKAPTITGRPSSKPAFVTPGPGQYSATAEILATSAPKFTMVGRPTTADALAAKVSYTPGPGAYDVARQPRTTRGISIKSRLPPPNPRATVPGPGHYNLPPGDTGPKFTMGARYELPHDDD